MCYAKYQTWLMHKRNRQNSVRSDCLGGETAGMLIRKTSNNDDPSGSILMNLYLILAFDGVAAASVPRDWSWSTF
jgi:hypothetical protein